MPANGLIAPLHTFDDTEHHAGNWGPAGRYGTGDFPGTAKFRYEQEHRGATLNHKNPMQLVLSGNPTHHTITAAAGNGGGDASPRAAHYTHLTPPRAG
eukprot:gene24117-34349_t